MGPLEYYKKKIASEEILEDAQQLSVMQKFQTIYETLTSEKSFLSWFKRTVPKGLYLWGNVGIGKTFLINTFYYTLPFEEKWRIHFLPFMRQLHADLAKLQGVRDPLSQIAKTWSKEVRVICFDELSVNDIGDALLLGKLLKALFHRGICVIFTSNASPDDLYKNGLQRKLFLPVIEEIKKHTEVIHLKIEDDYRANYKKAVSYYWYPLTLTAHQQMERCFAEFAKGSSVSYEPLSICHRSLPVIKQADGVIWLDFLTACGSGRNHEDYLALSEKFHTILLSDVLEIKADQNDLARRFIHLIDVLYDNKTRLIISAAVPIDKLYVKGALLFEFKRTISRLNQMQY